MSTQMEKSLWSRQKQSVVQGFIDERKKLVSAVAGRGFLLAPGFLYEFEMGLEIDTKQKLSDVSFKILSDAVERDIKQAGLDYDLAFKRDTMAWELDKQAVISAWDRELINIKSSRARNENLVEELAIEISKRELVLMEGKLAIELEMEGLRNTLAGLEDDTSKYEIDLVNQKILTAQAKLRVIPILQSIIAVENSIIVAMGSVNTQELINIGKEEDKIDAEGDLLDAKDAVIDKKIGYLNPAIAKVTTATDVLNTALTAEVLVKIAIVNKKVLSLGYQGSILAKQLLVEEALLKAEIKRVELAALKVIEAEKQVLLEAEAVKLEAKQGEIAALKVVDMANQVTLAGVKVDIETKQTEIDTYKTTIETDAVAIKGIQVDIETSQVVLDTKRVELEAKQVALKVEQLKIEERQVAVEAKRVELDSKQVLLQGIKVEIEAAQVKVDEWKVQIESAQVNIESIKTEIEEKQIELKSIQTQIDAKGVLIETAQTTAAEWKVKIAELKISELEKQGLIDAQLDVIEGIQLDILKLKVLEAGYQRDIDELERLHLDDRLSLLEEEGKRYGYKVDVMTAVADQNVVRLDIDEQKVLRAEARKNLTIEEIAYEKERVKLMSANVRKLDAKNLLHAQETLTFEQEVEKIAARTALNAVISNGEVTIAEASKIAAVNYATEEATDFTEISTAEGDTQATYGTAKSTLMADKLSRQKALVEASTSNEVYNTTAIANAQREQLIGEADINAAKSLTASLTHLIG